MIRAQWRTGWSSGRTCRPSGHWKSSASHELYRWYNRYPALGEADLDDRCPHPGRVWTRIPDAVRQQIVDLALDEPDLPPRELAVRFTDTQRYFVSEVSVYRLLRAHDLITSPASMVIKASDAFKDKTTRQNQLLWMPLGLQGFLIVGTVIECVLLLGLFVRLTWRRWPGW